MFRLDESQIDVGFMLMVLNCTYVMDSFPHYIPGPTVLLKREEQLRKATPFFCYTKCALNLQMRTNKIGQISSSSLIFLWNYIRLHVSVILPSNSSHISLYY